MIRASTNPGHQPFCEIEAQLSDGRLIGLRPIRPSDETLIRDGIEELSDRSRYLRFFSAFREPPEAVVKQLSAVDGHDHIGWGAILLDDQDFPPIGAARAIRSKDDPATGELAVAVLDDYQRLGLARLLTAVLLEDCMRQGMYWLELHVMSENSSATGFAQSLGAILKSEYPSSVVHYVVNVDEALTRLGKRQRISAINRQTAAT
jgi:GNAT superfamily N-acetyltransferase